MQHSSPAKTIAMVVLLLAAVVFLSNVSVKLWGGKPEKTPVPPTLTITEEMTVMEFGQANKVPNPALKEIFGLQQKSDLQKKLTAFGTADSVKAQVTKKMAIVSEHETKDWKKILIKFSLWFVFLAAVFLLFGRGNVSSKMRNSVLLLSVLLFGVILGADPSPMGTVKDAIHLFATSGAVFPPRLIALTVFLLIVFLANKYICAWGCQIGTLQDLVFRLNQNKNHKAIIGKRIKVPFVITNTFRVGFLCLFTVIAFAWGTDIIEFIDPFKIFKPIHLGVSGAIFVGIVLVMSLFLYRPWCHFFCPFGLAGWLVEKISLVKISVDYDSCIACQKCEQACPSTVMGAILKQDKKTIPDCFSCYVCRDVCPTQSISFSKRKRTTPPAGHFDRKRDD